MILVEQLFYPGWLVSGSVLRIEEQRYARTLLLDPNPVRKLEEPVKIRVDYVQEQIASALIGLAYNQVIIPGPDIRGRANVARAASDFDRKPPRKITRKVRSTACPRVVGVTRRVNVGHGFDTRERRFNRLGSCPIRTGILPARVGLWRASSGGLYRTQQGERHNRNSSGMHSNILLHSDDTLGNVVVGAIIVICDYLARRAIR
jgi:hypothetical protein